MKFSKCFKHAFGMVLHSKLRSWLTIIGIVIGVAAVIAIVSIGAGLQEQVNSQLSSLGGDILTITAGASRGFGGGFREGGGGGSSTATEEEIVLDRGDLQALRGLSDVKLIDTNIRGSAEVYYLGKKGDVSLTGVDSSAWYQISTTSAKEGRMLGPADTNVIVIGGRLAGSYFDSPVGINQMLAVEGRSFRVVGILDDEGSAVYMPIDSAYEVLDDKEKGVYDSFVVKVVNEDDLDNAIANIEQRLEIVRHVTASKRDFTVSSSKERQAQRAEIVSSITLFLTAIASVALLVGAVGIANTMFTSVLEKTKEIGIMKAIGATNKDILVIFLLNAALIGLIGGLLGVFFGTLLSGLLPSLLGASSTGGGGGGGGFFRFGSTTLVTLNSVIMALSISIFIGTASGAIPAYKASKLKPVDALRYE